MLTKRFFEISHSAARDDPSNVYLDNKVSAEGKKSVNSMKRKKELLTKSATKIVQKKIQKVAD